MNDKEKLNELIDIVVWREHLKIAKKLVLTNKNLDEIKERAKDFFINLNGDNNGGNNDDTRESGDNWEKLILTSHLNDNFDQKITSLDNSMYNAEMELFNETLKNLGYEEEEEEEF